MTVAPLAPPRALPASLSDEAEARAVMAFRDWLLQTVREKRMTVVTFLRALCYNLFIT